MMITEDYLMKALAERDIPINKRVLTDWRHRNYLPSLESRGRGQRRGRVYYWTDSSMLERAILVDELLCDGFTGTEVNMVLWLLGYEMPISIVRERLLAGIEKVEQVITGGNRSAGEIEDYISHFVYEYGRVVEGVNRKYPELKLSPPREPAEMEKFMNLLANPGLDLDNLQFIQDAEDLEEEPLPTEDRHSTNRMTRTIIINDEEVRSGWEWVRHNFSLAQLKTSLLMANDQDISMAGEDIRHLITTVGIFFGKLPESESLRPHKNHSVYQLGSALIAFDLSLRRAGFGPHIKSYLLQFCEKLEKLEPSLESKLNTQ